MPLSWRCLPISDNGSINDAKERTRRCPLIFASMAPFPDDVMAKRETWAMVRAYYRIRDPKVRDALRYMASSLARGAGSR